MTWMWEHPWVIGFIGLGSAAVMVAGFQQTRRRGFLAAGIATILVTGLLLAVEQWIVTDREQVRQTLYQIVDDLEANDRAAVLSAIDPQSTGLRAEVERNLQRVEVISISIKSNLHIEFDQAHPPNTARATFNVMAVVADRSGQYGGQHRLPYFVTVHFRRRQGRWMVEAYQLEDFRAGLRRGAAAARPSTVGTADQRRIAHLAGVRGAGFHWRG